MVKDKSPGRILARYLRAAGFAPSAFARACAIDKGALSKYLSGKRPIAIGVAMRIEQATRVLRDNGSTDVAPLDAATLAPALTELRPVASANVAPADHTPSKTGTDEG